MNKKQVIRINESQLKEIVMESVKRFINENNDDVDYYDYDDYRGDEPSDEEVNEVLGMMESECNDIGLKFKNLGDNEFGIIFGGTGKVDFKKFDRFCKKLRELAGRGVINNTGGGLSMNGHSRVRFRIIRGLK